jgi:hypothetical protein
MLKVIPHKLQSLIDQSQYAGGFRQTFESFFPLLGNTNTGLYFFPEYTDHGPQHIAGVLRSAITLIPNKAWRSLTPDDGVLLGLSALLHDIAMVLPPDGLIYLLTSENLQMIELLDETGWKESFDEFFADARRWDDRHLLKILGDKEKQGKDIEDLRQDVVHVYDRSNPETWSVRYRKFLGEFVRRHHARIAHEIARYGFPGESKATKLDGVSDDLADIAGLIARSHNMSLRDTYDYLDGRYEGHVICRDSHPIYIMVLLRIADYLQLDAKRANATWNSVQRLRSPISQEEWNTHFAVREVRIDEADRESLFISAIPETAANYIKIKGLLNGLQAELDISWAVISEVYGRIPEFADLGITLRRVRSNLDSAKQFFVRQNPSYFPIHAVFDTAGASLLKLLIRPLYGDRPEVGIRELMQNSLDAVRELRRLSEIHPELSKVPKLRQKADVLISISKQRDGHHYLTVSDKGIGMTAETVRDYFLKAGASFRQSDAWQKQFATDGRSTVLRSGRFGIGALAAFLLGDRVKLSTRSVWSKPEDGVAFEAGVDDDAIELKRVCLDVGTTIEIRLDENSAKELIEDAESSSSDDHMWDWYVLGNPVVVRRLFWKNSKTRLDNSCWSWGVSSGVASSAPSRLPGNPLEL